MGRAFTGLSATDRALLPARCAACVFWESEQRLPLECGAACDSALAAVWSRDVVDQWGEFGRVVIEDGELLGFIKYAPARYFPQARLLPSGPAEPDVPLITCMHIAPEARRRGLGGVLLRSALRDLSQRGERRVQAFALASRVDLSLAPMVGVEFLLRHGFHAVRAHPVTPLLELDLKTLVTWTENLESVLESLRIPVRVPRQAPVTLAQGGDSPGGR